MILYRKKNLNLTKNLGIIVVIHFSFMDDIKFP